MDSVHITGEPVKQRTQSIHMPDISSEEPFVDKHVPISMPDLSEDFVPEQASAHQKQAESSIVIDVITEQKVVQSDVQSTTQLDVEDEIKVDNVENVKKSEATNNEIINEEITHTVNEQNSTTVQDDSINSAIDNSVSHAYQDLKDQVNNKNTKVIEEPPASSEAIENTQHQVQEETVEQISVELKQPSEIASANLPQPENQKQLVLPNAAELQNASSDSTVEQGPVQPTSELSPEEQLAEAHNGSEFDDDEDDDDDDVEHSNVVVVTEESIMSGATKSLVLTEDGQEKIVTVREVRDEVSGEIYYVQTSEDVEEQATAAADGADAAAGDSSDQQQNAKANKTSHLRSDVKLSQIPAHILGRNIQNPAIDMVKNGRAPPTPRLGVKVPYRNLTSQMVSMQEITKEVLERSRRKSKDPPNQQNMFAKRLTQTLAKKIAPASSTTTAAAAASRKDATDQSSPRKNSFTTGDAGEQLNNSDLIAILEGDDDPTSVAAATTTTTIAAAKSAKNNAVMSKELERQIALKQLRELPDDNPEKVVESSTHLGSEEIAKTVRNIKTEDAVIEKEKTATAPKDHDVKKGESKPTAAAEVPLAKKKRGRPPLFSKDQIKTEPSDGGSVNDVENDDLPTNFAGNPPLKTYTRKKVPYGVLEVKQERSTTDTTTTTVAAAATVISAEIPKKIDLPSINSYVTKSSRVIKKKVIWDPDEAITPRKLQRTEPTNAKIDKKQDKPAEKRAAEPAKSPEVPKKLHHETPKKSIGDTSEAPKARKSFEATSNKDVAKEDKKTDINEKSQQQGSTTTTTTTAADAAKKTTLEAPNEVTPKTPVDSPPTKIGEKRGPGRPRLSESQKSCPSPKSPKTSPNMGSGGGATSTKKRLTEIHKLLRDEGAANMLYSLKSMEDDMKSTDQNISLENKTTELLNDLQTHSDKVSPKALRKKEISSSTTGGGAGGVTLSAPTPPPHTPQHRKKMPATVGGAPVQISRQKSRDSNRSSLCSPPSSPTPADASRIIRRHSSSSFSSVEQDSSNGSAGSGGGGKNGRANMIMDVGDDEDADDDVVLVREDESKQKKMGRDGMQQHVKRRGAAVGSCTAGESAKKKMKVDPIESGGHKEEQDVNNKYSKYKTFEVKTYSKLVQLIITPSADKRVYIHLELMLELTSILKSLENDSNCTVVLLNSSGDTFCDGINYRNLVSVKETIRKNMAKRLALTIKDFLLTMARFPKVLIAGVHGDIVGLGVTMLPLFDMVVASDSATFSTPYARLGCLAEAGSLFSLPHVSQNVLISELLFGSRKLISAEALRLGLVTRSLWPEKFQIDLLSITKTMAQQSVQFMEATKKLLRLGLVPEITAALDAETDVLVQHWSSAECQRNFSA